MKLENGSKIWYNFKDIHVIGLIYVYKMLNLWRVGEITGFYSSQQQFVLSDEIYVLCGLSRSASFGATTYPVYSSYSTPIRAALS